MLFDWTARFWTRWTISPTRSTRRLRSTDIHARRGDDVSDFIGGGAQADLERALPEYDGRRHAAKRCSPCFRARYYGSGATQDAPLSRRAADADGAGRSGRSRSRSSPTRATARSKLLREGIFRQSDPHRRRARATAFPSSRQPDMLAFAMRELGAEARAHAVHRRFARRICSDRGKRGHGLHPRALGIRRSPKSWRTLAPLFFADDPAELPMLILTGTGGSAMNPFFAYLNRLKLIQRWGLMRNTIPENDMEHSMQCALIAHALAVLAKTRYGNTHRSADRGYPGPVPRRERGADRRPAHPREIQKRGDQEGLQDHRIPGERAALPHAAGRSAAFLQPLPAPRPRSPTSGSWSRPPTASAPTSSAWRKKRPATWSSSTRRPPSKQSIAELDMPEVKDFMARVRPGVRAVAG